MIHFAQNAVLYRKSDGKSPEETGVAFTAYDTDRGFICENAKQESGNCDDYEVRFCCAVARCEWTRWLDRDDPGGTGDWEHLEGLRKDLGACSKPADIQARRYGWKMESSDWISASSVLSPYVCRKFDQKPAEETGESFRAYGPDSGFVCVNEEQEDDGGCQDYEVRLCCPAT